MRMRYGVEKTIRGGNPCPFSCRVVIFPVLMSLFAAGEAVHGQWLQTAGPYGGMIRCFAVTDSYFFCGTESGGVFRSADNGQSWTNSGLINWTIGALAVSKGRLFAGSIGGGVFCSDDNGANWSAVNAGLTDFNINALVVSDNRLYAGTYHGVFYSDDNGAHWRAVNEGLTNLSIRTLAVTGGRLFAGTVGSSVWRRPTAEMINPGGVCVRADTVQTFSAQPCTLSIIVENVTDLQAFRFELIYGSHIVHAETAWVGPFPASTGENVRQEVLNIDNASYPGRLIFGAAISGTGSGVSGSGILAHIVFRPQGEGSTEVLLKDVFLTDVRGRSIPVDAVSNGLIRVLPRSPLWVTTTDDDGYGSLREAIAYANGHAGPDTIRFDIPTTDPGCDSAGVFTIRPILPFYLIDSCTVIDGYSQYGASPNRARGGASVNAVLKIAVEGSMSDPYSSGFYVLGSENVIRGLVVSNFLRGIEIMGEKAWGNRIEGNFIGTDASGRLDLGNHLTGIEIQGGGGNVVGGASPMARNVISGNDLVGIELGATRENRIQGNYIGTDATGVSELRNGIGIRIFNVSQKNLIGGAEEGAGNWIAFNESAAVLIDGGSGEARQNTVSRNRIFGNSGGIELANGGNDGLAAPVIEQASRSEAAGAAAPFAVIEVFSDEDGQGALYEGTVTADAAGHWIFSKPEGLTGPYVTATATDTLGNTSEFSNPVYIVPEKVEQEKALPKAFALYPAYPNPFNGETIIRYEVPKSAQVRLSVYNSLGREIRTLVNAGQPAGYYTVRWDGTDESGGSLLSGVYVYSLKAGKFAQTRKLVLVK